VVPAAHYMCGGILTDRWARSSIPNLFAIGECACTGLHGANRLASNSLLEAMVFAHEAVQHCVPQLLGWRERTLPQVPSWPSTRDVETNSRHGEMILIAHNWDIIRRLMWNYVGIVRTDSRLSLAQTHIAQIRLEIREHMPHIKMNNDLLELQNLALVAQLIIRCAIQRKESRGLHYNLDYPLKDDGRWRRNTVIQREVESAYCE